MKIAIASGKGGTGKTFVATNLFYSLSTFGNHPALVDCDAEAPNALAFFKTELLNVSEVMQDVPVINKDACVLCGKCAEWCNYNAIFILPPAKFIRVIEDLCHGCGACTIACEYNAITEKKVIVGKVSKSLFNDKYLMLEAKTEIGVMSPVPVIKTVRDNSEIVQTLIIDAPPGTSCPFIQTVNEADFVVLVTEPTPFGLSDLKQSVETLNSMKKPYGVVINRAGLGNNDIFNYVEKEKILMEIPFSKDIASIYSKGKILSEEDSVYAEKFIELYNKIIKVYENV